MRTRVIPCLLLSDEGLVKTVRFADPTYVGDPINAVRIFSDRFVDEIMFMDIDASPEGRGPNVEFIGDITSECFIPFAYGGGIRSVADAEKLFAVGVEKIAVNTVALKHPEVVTALSQQFGAQSIIGAMDVKRGLFGKYHVTLDRGTRTAGISPADHAQRLIELGVGEILVNSVDRDGTMSGFDCGIVQAVNTASTVPTIACGGAGSLAHVADVVHKTSVSAAAAGSLFVFKGPHRAVLINYPARSELRKALGEI